MLFGTRFGIGRDLTDDRFNPSSGNSFNASYEQVAGDHTFGILSGTQRWYKTLHEDLAERKTILETKLLAAAIIGADPADGADILNSVFTVRPVRGDMNRDGITSTSDASIIKPKFGGDPAVEGAEFDYNVDGIVSTADFSQVKPLFGNTAPNSPQCWRA